MWIYIDSGAFQLIVLMHSTVYANFIMQSIISRHFNIAAALPVPSTCSASANRPSNSFASLNSFHSAKLSGVNVTIGPKHSQDLQSSTFIRNHYAKQFSFSSLINNNKIPKSNHNQIAVQYFFGFCYFFVVWCIRYLVWMEFIVLLTK